MSEHAVHWHEGMFLTPQHFQAADRRSARLRQLGSQWDTHYNWGLRTIEIDADALVNHRLVVSRLQARMHDGTLLSFPEDASLPVLDLQGPLQARDNVTVYLALPREHQSRPNTAGDASDLAARHVIDTIEAIDDDTGADPQTLQVLIPNVRLMTSGENLAGYDALPIARIRRSDSSTAAPSIDAEYIPPVLTCDAWSPLQRGVLTRILDRVERKAGVLSDQVAARRIGFDSSGQGERVLLEQLRILNEAAAVLAIDVASQGVAPWVAYRELARLTGRLSVFGAEKRLPKLPPYDHDNLATCFLAARRVIETLLAAVVEPSYQERPFHVDRALMQVAIEPGWLESPYAFYLGVQTSLAADEVEALLASGRNIKFGSADLAESLYLLGQAGLEPRRVVHPPRALPIRKGLFYYALARDDSPGEWRGVERTLSLAARLSEQLLSDDVAPVTPSTDDSVVLDVEGKSATLKLSLFVVQDEAAGLPIEEAAARDLAPAL